MSNDDKLLQTRVPVPVAEKVREAASREGLSVAAFLRRSLILQYRAEAEKPASPSKRSR